MNTSDRLIRKTYIGIWLINGTSILLGIACVLIDAVFTGQFLGASAVAAAGLVNPITLLVNIIGALMGPGLAIVCTRYLGRADKAMVNRVFSTVMICEFTIAALVGVVLFTTCRMIAGALGAGADNPAIIDMSADYLKGFAFAVVPMVMDVALSGLMVLDNDRGRGVASMLTILIGDVVFDYLNAAVIHGGMFGMAIATALSQVVGLLVVLTHFFRKDRILHFKFEKPDFKLLKEVALGGVPNAVSMGSNAVRGLTFNAFLLSFSGEVAVAAFGATNSLFSIINAVSIGIFNSCATLSSFLHGEEDRHGIVKTLRISTVIASTLFTLVCGFMLLFSPLAARGFLDATATDELSMASVFIRYMAVMYLLTATSYPLSGLYQGIGRRRLNYLFVGLRECILPIACTMGLGLTLGVQGFEWGLILTGIVMLLCCFIIPSLIRHKASFTLKDRALLPDDFGPSEDELYECSVNTLAKVVEASEQIMAFCKNKGLDYKLSYYSALFVEEMAGNSISYGHKNSHKVNVDIRVICKGDSLTIRIRDDGAPFDPVKWYEKNNSEDRSSGIGIRIITGLAKDLRYIPAMGLNNLMMKL